MSTARLKEMCSSFGKWLLIIFIYANVLSFFTSCSFLLLDDGSAAAVQFKKSDVLLIVVDETTQAFLTSALNQYYADLAADHFQVYSYIWCGGSAEDLRAVISNHYQTYKIDGAFLIGNLPAVWFEMDAFDQREEFPCDLYFMDLDASWLDKDRNGLFDEHSRLFLDIYTSRIMGTNEELIKYFDKVHRYRDGKLSMGSSAYIFKDDDWSGFNRGYQFGLDQIYKVVEICEKVNDTVRPSYVSKLTSGGAEYIYQWIHSYPSSLCVEFNNDYQYIDIRDIGSLNFKGLFFNLFDCSASRFTQDNIAMTYLAKTDYALATIGSTKVGGNYYPLSFNTTLSRHGTWGDAFKVWYNHYGITDDSWFLGMMILGDPALTVSVKAQSFELFSSASTVIAPTAEEIDGLKKKFIEFSASSASEGFNEYKERNPQFY